MELFSFTVFAIVLGVASAQQLEGTTTRYWDCCKPSCAWGGKALVTRPVETCLKDHTSIKNSEALASGCNGGPSFACTGQTAWAISKNVSYGFAAARISGQTEADWCCACYRLVFTSGPVKGKTMIVQITNTGGDLGANHFDIAIPGGGQGIFTGCAVQYNHYRGGQLYGGIRSRSECRFLPKQQQKGCLWRFDWFMNADNPSVLASKVKCPNAITDVSKCKRLTG
ncbi:MAG: hypothetical protein EBU90_02075 [Proteobacteria bacterium]|nr:hypothetical protein [Pseudomonadota bacterium]NBP13269.1 hypothetical protein [bacterium]